MSYYLYYRSILEVNFIIAILSTTVIVNSRGYITIKLVSYTESRKIFFDIKNSKDKLFMKISSGIYQYIWYH